MNGSVLLFAGVAIVVIIFLARRSRKSHADWSSEDWAPPTPQPEARSRPKLEPTAPKMEPVAQRQPKPEYICELCGKEVWCPADEPTRWYKNLQGERRVICRSCDYERSHDDVPPPQELLDRYNTLYYKVNGWQEAAPYHDWIEYQKISLRQFSGDITEEEAKRLTSELTKTLCEKYDKEIAEIKRKRAEQQEAQKKDFWSNRKTFY